MYFHHFTFVFQLRQKNITHIALIKSLEKSTLEYSIVTKTRTPTGTISASSRNAFVRTYYFYPSMHDSSERIQVKLEACSGVKGMDCPLENLETS